MHTDRSVRLVLQSIPGSFARWTPLATAGTLGRQPWRGRGKSKQGGWYCPDCDVVLRDSGAYLDHINGKKHQRVLGMNMRVERSTLPQVQAKLASYAGKLQQADKKSKSKADYEKEFEDRVNQQLALEKEESNKRKEARKAKREAAAAAKAEIQPDDGIDAEARAMAEAMGLPLGFA